MACQLWLSAFFLAVSSTKVIKRRHCQFEALFKISGSYIYIYTDIYTDFFWIRKLCTLHTQSAALAYTILESAISNSGLLESAISLTTQIIICTKLVSDVKSMMSPVLSVISSLISLSRDALFIDVCACY